MNPNNIPLKHFLRFLESVDSKLIRHHKGQYVYIHEKATRPIVLQDHIDPVPIMVVKNYLRTLGIPLDTLKKFK